MANPSEVANWLRYAREDQALARELAASSSAGAHRHSCFLAQQAAEMAIKAALIHLRGDSPRWHDLQSLRALLPTTWRLRTEAWQLEELTDWSVAARYPVQATEPSQADAVQMARLAGEVVETATDDLIANGWKP